VTDTVAPPGSRLISNLGNLGVNGAGDFINTGFQVNPAAPPTIVNGVNGFNPAPIDGTAITSTIERYRSSTLSLIHGTDRTQYRLTGFHTDYETLSTVTTGILLNGKSTGVDLAVYHSLTPRISGGIDANFAAVEDFGGKYDSVNIQLNGNYAMTPRMQAYFATSYWHRSAAKGVLAGAPITGDYSEARITIGIRRQFF
jgi:hypothetical protein